jgi:hypothetical protein
MFYRTRQIDTKKAKGKSSGLSVAKLTGKLQRVFNEWIRLRDKDRPCISCGSWNDLQAGHYFPAGHYTSVRFNEINVAHQCAQCNLHLHGNQANFRLGLVSRYGEEKVKLLEVAAKVQRVSKYSRFELELLIKFYQDKIKQLK